MQYDAGEPFSRSSPRKRSPRGWRRRPGANAPRGLTTPTARRLDGDSAAPNSEPAPTAPDLEAPGVAPPGTITAVEPQRRGTRFNVFIDGEFALSVDAALAAHLRPGQALDATALARLAAADEQRRAADAAFRLLAVRPRSAWEIETRLRQRGYSAAAITAARARLDRFGLADDAAFARYWVEQRQTFHPRGRVALRAELRAKGVATDTIAAAMPPADDETDAALRAARRQLGRFRGLDRNAFRQRLGAYLQRRGFGFQACASAVARLWEEAAADGDAAAS